MVQRSQRLLLVVREGVLGVGEAGRGSEVLEW